MNSTDAVTEATASEDRNDSKRNVASEKLSLLWSTHGEWLKQFATLTIFGVALWILHHELESIKLSEVVESLKSLPRSAVLLAVLLTIANYVVMVGYDWLAVKQVQFPLSWRQIGLVSFLYYAFSNSLGALLGGAPIRARLYSDWGMKPRQILRVLFLVGYAFWLGLFGLGGILFLVSPFEIPSRLNLPIDSSRPIGVVLIVVAALMLLMSLLRRRPLVVFHVDIQPPTFRYALLQSTIAAADFVLASAVLYVLLPSDISVAFFAFVAVYILAIVIGLISHVPGGLGILELVLITMIPEQSHAFVASLVAYRIIYYLVPMMIALATIAVSATRQHSTKIGEIVSRSRQWNRIVSPRIVTGAVFLSGILLLISGALPSAEGRMEFVRRLIPLPMVELTHFTGSLLGMLLLVLARGLQRRINVAWGATLVLLAMGIAVSLVKGLDYEEAALLGFVFVALIPCREHFSRRGALFAPTLSAGWIVALLMGFGLSLWLLLFSFRHIEYQHELWWQFAYQADAPRAMRAAVGVSVGLAFVMLMQLFRAQPALPPLASDDEMTEVAKIIKQSPKTSANLALLGDKRFLFGAGREAVVMYGCSGRTWVSMGDPIGPEAAADDAAWAFREACDAAGVWPAFYQVDESSLGRYVEMGLSMIKIGEDARVPLTDFTLDGSSRRDLRRTKKKSEEAGLSFEIVPATEFQQILPSLKEISDSWLGEKSTGEKGFSLGYFDEKYLARYKTAVIRDQSGPIAFSNIWSGDNKSEISIDLMRYKSSAPRGVMEYLFVELLLHGHAEGFEWFNLGMAPLSGIESRRLGPMWNRLSSLMFKHGEHFYNFQGLRSYKNKFDPVWFPKYLACPGGLAMPQVLANTATLISGGLGKLIHR